MLMLREGSDVCEIGSVSCIAVFAQEGRGCVCCSVRCSVLTAECRGWRLLSREYLLERWVEERGKPCTENELGVSMSYKKGD